MRLGDSFLSLCCFILITILWGKAGYQKIESINYFVEDVDKYYNHHGENDCDSMVG